MARHCLGLYSTLGELVEEISNRENEAVMLEDLIDFSYEAISLVHSK